MFGRAFRTFEELKEEVQSVVNARNFDEVFRSDLISDLIAERHCFCSKNGLRPEGFKKTDESPTLLVLRQVSENWMACCFVD